MTITEKIIRFIDRIRRLEDENQALVHKNETLQRSAARDQAELIFRMRGDGSFLFANEAFYRFFALTPGRLTGAPWQLIVHADDLERICQELSALAPESPVLTSEVRVHAGNGQLHWMEFRNRGSFDANGLLSEIEAVGRNTSVRRQTEKQLRKLSLAVEQSPNTIIITNLEAEIEYVNESFVSNTGYSREEIIGQNPRVLKSGKTPPTCYIEMWQRLTQGQVWKGELCNRRKDGSEHIEHTIIVPVRQADGCITHYVAMKEDITARKAAADRINRLACYDSLTQLPNRRLLIEHVHQALQSFSRHQRAGALLLIDLDDLKSLNDTLGHEIGDMLLQEVAHRLLDCVRATDKVFRLWGDEFVVVLEDLSQNVQQAAYLAETLGIAILSALRQPYQLASYSCLNTSSIGISLFAKDLRADDLLRQVDLAMSHAKAAGRNVLRFFNPQMQAAVNARAFLYGDLRLALEQEQFQLHYQAQVIGAGRLTGAEVLLRWRHPERGMISPADFIPLAESSGLILPIGRWVLDTACATLAKWASQPALAHLTLAVNVSARQFKQDDFVTDVSALLVHYGIDPSRLKLELTENMLVDDVEEMISTMETLRLKGVRFSLDDFGTGYSSLAYLKRLPLDQLKIDQGFIRDILIDANDAAIARMVVALGKSMGLGVIAEGVEHDAQREFLARLGCQEYQGYLFSSPLPLKAFEKLARAEARKNAGKSTPGDCR